MKCNKCGFESERDFEYCMNCGTKAKDDKAVTVEAVSLNPAVDIVMPALKDKLFLVLCILMTTVCALSLATSGMPLIYILITVFLWLTYADAQKGIVNEKHLQFISGTVYAQYIIANVVSIILLVCGVLFGILFEIVAENISFWKVFVEELEKNGLSLPNTSENIMSICGILLSALFVFIAVIVLVFNLLGMRKIHRFAKSIYLGIVCQNSNFERPRTVKNWFIFIAVMSAITVLGNLTSFIAAITSVCTTAIMIIVAMLIDKYFVKEM